VSAKPLRVKITYCADCGYEPQALDLTKALMYEFGSKLSAIEIIPWESGTFDVSVDGELVHSMKREGGFPEHATVKSAVRSRIGGAPAG
jgi:selenoprotein W-related protein